MFNQITNNYLSELIKESVNSNVYHFTTLNNMYSIAQLDTIQFSRSVDSKVDAMVNKNYQYHLSLQRTPVINMGYVHGRTQTKDNDWNYIVRIEFNGDKLNRDFKGEPVNYFSNTYYSNLKNDLDKNKFKEKFNTTKSVYRNGNFDIEPLQGDKDSYYNMFILQSQYEDRIFSNEKKWSNISEYVKHIDILFPVTKNVRLVNRQKIDFIAQKYGDKCRIFCDIGEFNYYSKDYTDRFGREYKNKGKTWEYVSKVLGYDNDPKILTYNMSGLYNSLCYFLVYYTIWRENNQHLYEIWYDYLQQVQEYLEIEGVKDFEIESLINNCQNLHQKLSSSKIKSADMIERRRKKEILQSPYGSIINIVENLIKKEFNNIREFVFNYVYPFKDILGIKIYKGGSSYHFYCNIIQSLKIDYKYGENLYTKLNSLKMEQLKQNRKKYNQKTQYVTNNQMHNILTESVIKILKEELTRGQMESALEDLLKSKDFEKKVNHIVIDTLGDFLENMWTKKSFWKTMMKKK